MNNQEFFAKYASSCAVGLVGSSAAIDRSIRKAQKKITSNKRPSAFSHAFIFSEKRTDGQWWLLESDLEIHAKQVKLGVQENRIDKYFDEKMFPNVALLDFKLDAYKKEIILKEALNILANRATYSLREILGVLFSFQREELRKKENIFAQDNSFICSSFVQHCYSTINLSFNPEVSIKNITPEDIYTTQFAHVKQKLIREE